jgi:hypothetical protein
MRGGEIWLDFFSPPAHSCCMAYCFKSARCALYWAIVGSLCLFADGFAQATAVEAATSGDQVAVDARPKAEPMDLAGVEPRLAHVLQRYYENSFGGAANWERIQSVRFEGDLRLPQGTFSFVAFKKKPSYCKVVLFGPNGGRIVMAYDGEDAWQLNSVQAPQPAPMPSAEALNFIRDATTGGHLLFSTAPGKRIELLDTQRVGQESCRNVRVTLSNGQQITYAIGMTSFAERQQAVVNALSGKTEVTTHSRTQEFDGLLVPMQSSMAIDGEFRHEVQLHSVTINVGVMPWMFSRPAGAYIPGSVPPVAPLAGDHDSQSLAELDPLGAESSAFNVQSSGFEDAGASRFRSLDEETKRSILDDLDAL